MCSRVVILLVALALPLPARAQSTAELRQRAVRLQSHYLSLGGENHGRFEPRFPQADTVVSGEVMALVPKRYRSLARASFDGLTSDLSPVARAALSPVAGTMLFVLYHSGDLVRYDTAAALLAGRRQVRLIDVDSTSTKASVIEKAQRHLATRMRDDLDSVAADWLRDWMPMTAPTCADRERVYVNLATEASAVARRCATGDLVACALALRITPVRDPVRELYDASDRRLFVSRLNRNRDHRATMEQEGVSLCLAGNDMACEDELRKVSINLLPQPADQTALSIFFYDVLRAGGAGAMDRFRSSAALPLRERLEKASGRPLEDMLSDWHRSIRIGGSPLATRMERWTTLSFAVVMLGLAVMRREWA
jgi:hypothetical protein